MNYSNNHIAEDVYRNYKLKGLINKMIDYSAKDGSDDDLEMYIYEILLGYDNTKLNSMYQNGSNTNNPNRRSTKLRSFISQIILNARNGGVKSNNHIYQTQFHIKNSNEFWFDQHDIEDVSTYDFSAEIIITYIDKKAEMIDGQHYTSEQLKYILSFTLLKKYFMSDLTQIALASHLNLSRGTVSKLLKVAKNDIIDFWEHKGKFVEYKNNLE